MWNSLTDEDTAKLQRFALHVGQTLGLECEWSWHDQVDIAREGNSKGKTPGAVGGVPGLSMQDVIAFGDNYNDLSMLEAAGTGVAMGNAVEEVKARANVVIGENETTSIADYIYRHLLYQAAIDTLLSAHAAAGPGQRARSSRAQGADARPQRTAAYFEPDLNLPMAFNTLHNLRGQIFEYWFAERAAVPETRLRP